MAKRIESRVTHTERAWEQTPTVAADETAEWSPIDLNTYSDSGATYEATPRSVMTGNRNVQKGAQTSRTAKFGYNIDNTVDNVLPQIAAFMYNQPKEQPSSRSVVHGMPVAGLPDGTPPTAITATSVTVSVAVAGTLAVGDIIIVEDGVNNRSAQQITAISTGVLTLAPVAGGRALVVPDSIPVNAAVRRVGMVLTGSSSVAMATDGSNVTLTAASAGFGTKSLSVGQWVFLGKDSTPVGTGNNVGFYGRISKIEMGKLTLDTTTAALSSTAAADTDRELYFGTFIVNGNDAYSFTHSRYLGIDPDGKHMREITSGCMSSELALNINEKSLVNMDLTYMASDAQYLALDDVTEQLYTGNTLPLVMRDPVNTSTDIVRQRLSVPKIGQMNTAEIHSFVRESTLNITNNLQEATANGHLGNIGTDAGDFGLTGTINTYFNSVAALSAVRCNCTVALDWILARKNQGIVVDIPALQLGSDSITVEKGASVQISLTQTAFEVGSQGYTMSYGVFHYLPNVAMPSDTCDC